MTGPMIRARPPVAIAFGVVVGPRCKTPHEADIRAIRKIVDDLHGRVFDEPIDAVHRRVVIVFSDRRIEIVVIGDVAAIDDVIEDPRRTPSPARREPGIDPDIIPGSALNAPHEHP